MELAIGEKRGPGRPKKSQGDRPCLATPALAHEGTDKKKRPLKSTSTISLRNRNS